MRKIDWKEEYQKEADRITKEKFGKDARFDKLEWLDAYEIFQQAIRVVKDREVTRAEALGETTKES